MIRYPDNIADFVPGAKPGETGLDLSPWDLAERLKSVRTYTAAALGGHGFVDPTGERRTDEVILVSIETRDAIINALRGWK